MSAGLRAICRLQRAATPKAAVQGMWASVLSQLGLVTPPIPLSPVARYLDVSWPPCYSAGGGTGTLRFQNDSYRVFLNEPAAKQRWRRVRFTLAHELTHVMILKHLKNESLVTSLDANKEAHNELERVCNVGAAELLMPSRAIRTDLRRFGLAPVALSTFYDRYLVSREALVWRLASAIPSGAAIRWRRFRRHDGEPECWRVVRSYPPYSASPVRPWLPQGATIRHVQPDIITTGYEQGVVIQPVNVVVMLDRREWRTRALVTSFPARRQNEQPRFEGFLVPDEPPAHWKDELLFFSGELPEVGAGVRSSNQ